MKWLATGIKKTNPTFGRYPDQTLLSLRNMPDCIKDQTVWISDVMPIVDNNPCVNAELIKSTAPGADPEPARLVFNHRVDDIVAQRLRIVGTMPIVMIRVTS
jgi:hypothetical protein